MPGVEAMPLKKFELGGEAIDYIASELINGKSLAHLLSFLPLQEGSVVTYLPDDVEEDAWVHFEWGGVGSSAVNSKVAELIAGQLRGSAQQGGICVLEHPVASKGDPFLARRHLPFFTVGGEVYLFADAA